MKYPLISEYIKTIISAEDNFKKLSCLKPVLGVSGTRLYPIIQFESL